MLPAPALADYVAGAGSLGILQGGQYATVSGRSYLKFIPHGRNLPQARSYVVGSKLPTGTQVGEQFNGQGGECVALVKAVCGCPQTSRWRRGRKALGNNLPAGTALATFAPVRDKSGRIIGWVYSGHATILRGYVAGGLAVFSQNWPQGFRCVTRHTITATGKGGIGDAHSYFAIV